MKKGTCARQWQVEAVEDRRLSEADEASFERHVRTCPSCAQRWAFLAELRTAGSRLPVPPHSELAHRRARQVLLGQANDLSVEPQLPRRSRRIAMVLAPLLVVAVVVAGWWVVPRPATAPPAAVPNYRWVPTSAARVRTVERGATVRVAVDSGQVEFSVAELLARQRFIVEMPDGQVEVRGTRFTVEVVGGRTRSVWVKEGRVALSLRGQSERPLERGERWTAPKPPRMNVEDEPEQEIAVKPASVSVPKPVAAADRVTRRSSAPRVVRAPKDSAAGASFEVAMAAFVEGDYGRAERLLARFERAHPTDARVEDTTFLRAVSRARRGDRKGAAGIASEYLRRFPNGLRQPVAQRLRSLGEGGVQTPPALWSSGDVHGD